MEKYASVSLTAYDFFHHPRSGEKDLKQGGYTSNLKMLVSHY